LSAVLFAAIPVAYASAISIAVTHKSGLMVGARTFPGNPYDGHILSGQLEQTAILLEDVGRIPKDTTPKLPQFTNITLLPLPAGSPELNPAEQVWQQLRDRSLANRCYDSYEQIVEACCSAWNKFTQVPGVIRSLCSRSWTCLTPELKKE
jgi:hypothetical protein